MTASIMKISRTRSVKHTCEKSSIRLRRLKRPAGTDCSTLDVVIAPIVYVSDQSRCLSCTRWLLEQMMLTYDAVPACKYAYMPSTNVKRAVLKEHNLLTEVFIRAFRSKDGIGWPHVRVHVTRMFACRPMVEIAALAAIREPVHLHHSSLPPTRKCVFRLGRFAPNPAACSCW